LVESIKHLPQFRGRELREHPEAFEKEDIRSLLDFSETSSQGIAHWQFGRPDPVGDLPLDDFGSEDGNLELDHHCEVHRGSLLGTTRKVCVDVASEYSRSSSTLSLGVGVRQCGWEDFFRHRSLPTQDMGEPHVMTPTHEDRSSQPCFNGDTDGGRQRDVEHGSALSQILPGSHSGQAMSSENPLVSCLDLQTHNDPPGLEERRWIEAAVRRMFRALSPIALEAITEAFREWRLPPCHTIVKQGSPISSGPGLCILFEGVVDVLHWPSGSPENEKVCTYDRPGQCFGELELFYDAPRAMGTRRKVHWATIATRTTAVIWAIERVVLRGSVPGAASATWAHHV